MGAPSWNASKSRGPLFFIFTSVSRAPASFLRLFSPCFSVSVNAFLFVLREPRPCSQGHWARLKWCLCSRQCLSSRLCLCCVPARVCLLTGVRNSGQPCSTSSFSDMHRWYVLLLCRISHWFERGKERGFNVPISPRSAFFLKIPRSRALKMPGTRMGMLVPSSTF